MTASEEAATASTRAAADPPMRRGAFWTIWSGQALSLAGSQASQFALVWWLTLQTGSPAVLSTATLFALLPTIVLGPAIGALVDRWSRRATMLAADGAVALGSLALAGLFLAGGASTTAVLGFLLWRAIGGAFHAPAMLSATSLMVSRQDLGRIQGVNQMLQGGLGILTAPAGAALLGLVGMTGVMAVDVATALLAMAPLLFIRVPEPERRGEPEAGKSPGLLADLGSGLRYLRGLPGHIGLIGGAAVINLFCVPAFALLPLLMLQEMKGDVAMQAWATSAFGAGAIGGGLALSAWGGSGRRARAALGSILGLGLATLSLGATPAWLWPLAILALFAVGVFSALANGCIATIMQATIAPEYQGRVFTLMMSAAAAMTPAGLLLAAPVADLAGVRAWYAAGGVVCAAMGAAAFLVRPIVQIEASCPAAAAPGRQGPPHAS
ncbi:MAG TPA: MFS transporter [Candidatus Polarisedimenticolia bacterium]|nr:MFS transporter [Candidatus Polarisedimenticolia bacterium]